MCDYPYQQFKVGQYKRCYSTGGYMKYFLIISLIFSSSFSLIASELNIKIEKTFESYLEDREGYIVNYQINGNINGFDENLLLIQWSMIGATYWQNYLSVFNVNNDEVSTIKLLGVVKDVQIKEGVILINTKQKASNDPRCCPSLDEKQFYYIESGKIIRMNHTSQSTRTPNRWFFTYI